MPDFGLQVAIADTVKELLGDTLEHRKSTSAAITPDGRVAPAAVAGALPWQAHDGKIEGTVTTGSNRLRWHFPQGGVIRQVSYDVRTAPSGGALQFTLSGGSSTETMSLQAGQTSGVTNTSIRMAAGSWARLNVTAANGAADLAVTLQYESLGSGSTASGGSGGGGGGTISVISVNGQTGVVVLDADDIDDTTTTHKFMSAAEKTKLASFEPGDYVLASSLALVATSGDYEDLSNKPTLGTAAAMNASSFASAAQGAKADTAVQPGDLADVATSGSYGDLAGKPPLGTAAAMDSSAFATSAQGAKADTAVQPTDLGDLATKDDVSISDIAASGSPSGTTYLRGDGTWSTPPSGGGGGAVDSVNGQTGIVVLDADDIDDTTNRLWLAAAERTKLAGIEAGAEVNVQSDWGATSGDAAILNKPAIYTQPEIDEMWSGRLRAIPSFRSASDPVSTTSISSATPYWWDNEATGIVRYIALSEGTWEFEVNFAMKNRRSVTTGGVMISCSVDGQQVNVLDYQTTPRNQFFYTADARRVIVEVTTPRTISIRLGFCGWDTEGTTYGYQPLLTGTYQRL